MVMPPVMGMGGAGAPGRGLSSGLAGEVEPGSPDELITLNITATLTEPISIPQPPGAAVVGIGPGVGMGMPGMPPGVGMTDARMMGPGGPVAPGGAGVGGRLGADEADMEAEELER